MFFDLEDQGGKVQVSIAKNDVGSDEYELIKKTMDVGDVVGVEGSPYKTRKGELTVGSSGWSMLAKSTRPLPSKIFVAECGEARGGLRDEEVLYRQPELRMIVDSDAREVFARRSRVISSMRSVLEEAGYIEIEIPTLQPVYGGASARPFVTSVNALDSLEVYLSISPEIYLKRLMVGGFFDGVFFIGKSFRNEGIDKSHHPEFTSMECYKAFWDYNDLMNFTERMVERIFRDVNGSASVVYEHLDSLLGRQELDFSAPWRRVRMSDMIKDEIGVDVEQMDESELRTAVQQVYAVTGEPYLSIDNSYGVSWGNMVLGLFESYVEKTIVQPTFVIDHPRESSPLCKLHRGDERFIERFEVFVYGMELANAYTELNDPVLQRRLLEDQERSSAAGDLEAQRMDEAFCQAIEYGMPPTAGLGIGVDRLVMLVTGRTRIKDVIPFPLVRPMKSKNL